MYSIKIQDAQLRLIKLEILPSYFMQTKTLWNSHLCIDDKTFIIITVILFKHEISHFSTYVRLVGRVHAEHACSHEKLARL